jgi:gliding motility-associated-like protein
MMLKNLHIFTYHYWDMKKLLYLLLFFFPFISQAQWYPVPMPTTQGLEAITFTDTLHGYIAAWDGSVLESSDGGINWHTLLTGTSNGLTDIWFPTASTGYSAGNGGAIIKTINAGNTWSVINSPTGNVLRGVYFLNPDTGFICGQQESIYKTTNGGTTWVQQTTGPYWLRQFSFPTPQIGYCAGDNHLVFKTTNGGLSWNQIPGSGGINLNDIQFLTVDTGYVCGLNGYVAKSFNSGQTWQVLNTGTTTDFEGLWFFNTQAGYCVGPPGIIMKTTDGGATWTQETSGTSVFLRRLYFLHPNQGFICGDVGTLLENCLPAPGPITGPSPVCQGDVGKIYSVIPVTGAAGYHWSVPPGVIITSGSNTNSITVTFTPAAVSGSFSVYAFKANCNGATSPPFPVIVNPPPVPTLVGPNSPCIGSTNNNYITDPAMTSYIWTVSSGGTITSGLGTNSITVTWNAAGPQTVSVTYTSTAGCTSSNPTVLNVTVNTLPGQAGPISGSPTVCAGANGVAYSVAPIPNTITYIWALPPNATIASGAGTNSITVNFAPNASGGDIIVWGTNSCGDGQNSPPFAVIVTQLPVAASNITGPSPVCAGTEGFVYAVSPVSGASSYVWTLPSGFSIVSGNGTNTIIVTIASNAFSGNIFVYGINNCGNGQSSPPFPVIVNYPAAGSAGPDGLTCQTTPFTVTQASASNDSAVIWHSTGQGTLTGTTTLSPTYTPAQGETDTVTLILIIYGNAPCSNDTSKMILTIEHKATINAGNDLITCGQTQVVLSGSSASDYQSLFWTTSGSGVFNDPTILHPAYTPGISDVNAGSVFLTLHATSVQPCEPDSSKVLLTIVKPVYVNAGPDSSVCEDRPFTVSNAIAGNYSTVTWSTTGDGTFNDPTIVNPVYTPGNADIIHGSTLLILTVEGVSPCPPASDSLLLTINRKPSVHPGPDGVICQGMTFTVDGVTASEFSHFTWQSNGQGILSDTTTLSPVYTPGSGETGTVNLVLKVFGNLACHDSMVLCRMKVNIYTAVIAEAGNDQTIAYNTMAMLQGAASGGSGNYSYEWQPSSLVKDDTARLTLTVPLKEDTLFIVTVTDKATGCSASDSIRIYTGPGEGLDSCIVVHNVITPNGDGLNDTWIIDCIENYPDNTVQIFNRWGDRVNSFDRYDNTTQVWKGTNTNGKLLPSGTYYYVLQIKNEKTRSGWILLRGGFE